MNEVVPFVFNHDGETTAIRVTDVDGSPWFITSDAGCVLEIRNIRSAITALDADEKGVVIIDTPGGRQEVSIISEPGLYKLIQRSRKPAAKAFDRFIRHDVLPTIRRTGKYELPTTATGPQQPDLLEAINDLRTDVKYIRGKMDGGRQGFSKADVRYVCEGLAKSNDCRCWYCNDTKVVDEYGQRLEGKSELHHADGNKANNSLENCMLPCLKCHHKLTHKSDAEHIPAWRALGRAETFHTRLRQQHGLIRPPKTPANIWEFRPMKQTNMGFPRMPVPANRKHSA